MKTIKPFRLTTLYRPYSWRGKNFLSIVVFALADLKNPAAPKLLSDIELWREVLPELDCDGVIDHVLPKTVPEFLIGGHAYTHHQADKCQVIVKAKIADLEKDLLVFGDRYKIGGQVTQPKAFERMPVTWARAFGGKDVAENPSGMGSTQIAVNGQQAFPLPNIENPLDRFHVGKSSYSPYGFGPINMLYPRRFGLMGTYSEAWRVQEFPGFFPDMNPLIFNAAEPDQRWPSRTELPLGEEFRIWNMHPDLPCWRGTIPEWHAKAFIKRKVEMEGNSPYEAVDMRATTAWFVPDQERLLLIYHGNIEVAEDDASDISCLMTGLEISGQERSLAYYEGIMRMREDPNEAGLHVLCDDELITGSILGDINIDIEAVYQTPSWIKSQNYKNKVIAEQRQVIVEAGVDPNEYLPEEYGPHKRYTAQDLSLLARETANLEKEAEEDRKRIEKESAEQRAEYERRGMPIPDVNIRESGPPKELFEFTSDPGKYAQTASLKTGELDLGRLFGPDLASNTDIDTAQVNVPEKIAVFVANNPEMQQSMDWMKDPAFQRKMRSMRPLVHKSYLHSAQSQGAARKMDPEESAWVRKQVLALCQKGEPLSSLDLTGADLARITFEGVDFNCALLENSDLSDCRFVNCVLSECVLTRADLSNTTFIDCNLEEANLSKVVAHGTVFERCRFKQNILEDTTFERCQFREATLDSMMPDKIRFVRCQLADCEVSMSILNDVSIIESRWDNVTMKKVSFQSAVLEKSIFADCGMDGCSFFIANLANTYFHASRISNSAFMHQTQLVECSFEGSTLKNCNFRETPMVAIDLEGAHLETCDFSLADMRHANLKNCRSKDSLYIRSVLNGSDFNNANMTGSDLKAADLRDANFTSANVFRANFSLSHLDGSTILTGAYTKEANTYPKRKGG